MSKQKIVDRQKLSPKGQAHLQRLVAGLFAGEAIQLSELGQPRFLCYRMGGEALPRLPQDEAQLGALASGIFISATRHHHDRAPSLVWMQAGPLDEVLYVLGDLDQDVEQFLEAYSVQTMFRSGSGVPADRGYIEVVCTGPGPTSAESPNKQANEPRTRAQRFR